MSDTSNVWDAGDAAADAPAAGGAAALGPQSDELPPVADLFMATIEDFKENWAAHGMTGLGLIVVLIPSMMLIIAMGYAPLIGAAILESEIALILSMFWMFFAFMLGIAAVTGPVMYAMFSAQNAHLEGDEDALGIGSFFSRLLERPAGAIGYQITASGLGFVGVFFFIIGAIIVQIAMSMALPAMVVHRMGVIAAITRSANHMKDHFVWHLGFWGLGFVVMAIAGNIPLVGYAFGMPFFASYMLRGYRAVFGGSDSEYASV